MDKKRVKSLVSLPFDKRLKGKSGIYKMREGLGLRLVMPKPKTVVAKPSAKVTLRRLLECSRSESKPKIPLIRSVAPESMTQGS